MSLYKDYLMKKKAGQDLDFSNISKEELKTLFYDENTSDRAIAELFNVKSSQVKIKRAKMGINFKELLFLEALENIPDELNQERKSSLLSIDNLSEISKAVTHFAFRNGPVEDMHANGQLSQADMKTLNKFMVNRLAYVFKLIIEEKWCELDFLIRKIDTFYGNHWDMAVPDNGNTIKIMMADYKQKMVR